jgi:hypothetical protein
VNTNIITATEGQQVSDEKPHLKREVCGCCNKLVALRDVQTCDRCGGALCPTCDAARELSDRPSTADADRAKERERLIEEVKAAGWENAMYPSPSNASRLADTIQMLAAFDAENGGNQG